MKTYAVSIESLFYQVKAKDEEQAIKKAYKRLLEDIKAQNIDTDVEELPY
jgi:hypothetical protein